MAQAAEIDLLLIGDSVGTTMMGYADTVPVTVEDMIHHGKMVRRGAPDMFLVCDMPFLSYHCGDDDAIRQAFSVTPRDNTVFLPKVMSRKKQVIPMLSDLWG